MKIAIIGTGGIGGYFGGKLAKAGYDVTFLARGKQLEALKERGLTVKSLQGDFHVEHVNATDKNSDIGNCDLVMLCLKAWQVKEIAGDLKSILHENSIILPLQNGVQTADELQTVIDSKHIIGGLCRIISKIESPGVINHFGINPIIVFGELNNSITDRVNKIKEVFDKAGINAKVTDDIQSELWKKFIGICVSGLLAITKTNYGELRELPETRQMMIDLLTEIYLLSHKVGAKIECDFVEKTVAAIDAFPYDTTSSLTRDVWEGKPSEIEYQNGAVVRIAAKYKMFVPVNRFVYSCILPMELKARNQKK